MSKGSGRRPSFIDQDTDDRNWHDTMHKTEPKPFCKYCKMEAKGETHVRNDASLTWLVLDSKTGEVRTTLTDEQFAQVYNP